MPATIWSVAEARLDIGQFGPTGRVMGPIRAVAELRGASVRPVRAAGPGGTREETGIWLPAGEPSPRLRLVRVDQLRARLLIEHHGADGIGAQAVGGAKARL